MDVIRQSLLLLFVVAIHSTAIEAQQSNQKIDINEVIVGFKFTTGEEELFISFDENNTELNKLNSLIDKYRNGIYHSKLILHINSYCASLNNIEANLKMALTQDKNLQSESILKINLKQK